MKSHRWRSNTQLASQTGLVFGLPSFDAVGVSPPRLGRRTWTGNYALSPIGSKRLFSTGVRTPGSWSSGFSGVFETTWTVDGSRGPLQRARIPIGCGFFGSAGSPPRCCGGEERGRPSRFMIGVSVCFLV